MSDARNILVPLDGSARAESILPYAESLARGLPARLTLLRVLEPTVRAEVIADDAAPPLRPEKLEEARRYLLEARDRLRAAGVEAEHLLMRGIAIDAIVKAARDQGCTLIAMTTRGQTGMARALFGNVALGVLNRAPCPLLMVRSGEAEPCPQPRRILLPLDGSQRAEAVLPHAEALAAAYGAELVLLRVVRNGMQGPAFAGVDDELTESTLSSNLFSKLGRHHQLGALREAQEYLREQRAALQARGVAVDAVLAHGRPVETIVRLLDERDIEMVALTNHLRRGLVGLLYGSVAASLLEEDHRPLLVVPTGSAGTPNFS